MSVLSLKGTVTIRGKVAEFAPVECLGVRESFEDWMVQEAYRLHWKTKKLIQSSDNPEGPISASDWEEDRDRLRRDVTAGAYSWGTELWSVRYNTLAGQKKCCELQFGLVDRKTAPGLVESLFSLPPEQRRDIVADMLSWGRDPNPQGAEKSSPDLSAQSQ